MDLSVLREKRTKVHNELETILTGDTFSSEDNKKSDDLLLQLRKLDQQIKQAEADEVEDEKEARKELGKATEETQWRNDRGHSVNVFGCGPTIHVRNNQYDIDLGRFLQIAYLGKGSTTGEKRALAESSGTGGYTVPEFLFREFVDRLRAASPIFRQAQKLLSWEPTRTVSQNF